MLLECSSRYDPREKIAVGGMGEIWSASDQVLKREVALKVVPDDHASDLSVCRRFERESRIVARLQHPGIPPVYDLARLPDGRPMLAMKRVFGKTLRDCLSSADSQSLEWFLDVFLQICRTLAYAHSRGFVHRDLKPENVMVGQFGETQVMDWGIAESYRESRTTTTEKVVGTPAYMSPEQALGLRCGPRSDVFSLGIMLCEILIVVDQSDSANTIETLRHAISGGARRVRELLMKSRAEVPLVELAVECIEFEPTRRCANAGVLADRLVDYNHDVQVRLKRSELERTRQVVREKERERRKALYLSIAVLVSIAVAISGIAITQNQQRNAQLSSMIQQAMVEATTLRRAHLDGNGLAKPQLDAAMLAAQRAQRLTRQPAMQSHAKDCDQLVRLLEQDQRAIRRQEQLYNDLSNALLYPSRRTVEERFEQRQRSRRDKLADNHFHTLLFLNKESGMRLVSQPQGDGTEKGRNEIITATASDGPTPHSDGGRRLQVRPTGWHRTQREQIDRIARAFAFFENVFPFAKVQCENYKRAFAAYGIQPDDDLHETVESLSHLKQNVRLKAISGLRLWFLYASDSDAPSRDWLAALLRELDKLENLSQEAQNWRDQVRQGILQRNPETLFLLCDQGATILDQQPEELVWGMGCYVQHFSDPRDESFLRLAQLHHPQSYLLNRTLALLDRSRSRPDQTIPYLMAALAIVPDQELFLAYARKPVQGHRRREFATIREISFKASGYDPRVLFEWADATSMIPPSPQVSWNEVYQDPIDVYREAIKRGFHAPGYAYARMGQLHFEANQLELALEQFHLAAECPELDDRCRAELDQAIKNVRQIIDDAADQGTSKQSSAVPD